MTTRRELMTAPQMTYLESYFSEDEDLSDCPEEPLFDGSCDVSPYICHVKIKKAILKAHVGFIDEINQLQLVKGSPDEIAFCQQTLIAAIKECNHKLILSNAIQLLEREGVFDCVCYVLELGKHCDRGRLIPVRIRQRRLPSCPDINQL